MNPDHKGRRLAATACALGLALAPGLALAHHSFAVFFSADQDVTTLKGAVKQYRFTNPHGIIDMVVTTPAGAQEEWRVETNSPSILAKRGWSQSSIAVGEVISVQGWRARDGSKYMRLKAAFRANGAPIGMAIVGDLNKP